MCKLFVQLDNLQEILVVFNVFTGFFSNKDSIFVQTAIMIRKSQNV